VELDLPAMVVRLLVHLLTELADGNAVTIMPIHAELTTQQAADLLGVSRPFIVKQMEGGAIAFRKVGSHRRIAFGALKEYKDRMHRARVETLKELAKHQQEMGLD
jgi:excisionase family DNA binding protein